MATPASTSAHLPTEREQRISSLAHDLTTRHIHAQITTLAAGLFRLKGGTKRDWETYNFRETLKREHEELLDEIPDSDEWRNYPPQMDEYDLKNQFPEEARGYYDMPFKEAHRTFRDFLGHKDDTPLDYSTWLHDAWDLFEEGDARSLTDQEVQDKFPQHYKLYQEGRTDRSDVRQQYETFARFLVDACGIDHDQVEEEGYEINWYVVTDWAQGQLESRGQIVADVGGLCLWGRITGFQLPESDACWQSIAEAQIAEEEEHERYRREHSSKPAAE